MSSRRRLQVVRDVAGGRSFVTIASVLPEGIAGTPHAEELRDAVKRYAARLDLDTMVKFVSDANVWNGLGKLVESYGFGPIVPNTVVVGHPEPGNLDGFGSLVRLVSDSHRNVIVADGDEDILPSGAIDIWWRGRHSNAALTLALAFLLRRADCWRKYKLRVNMIVADKDSTTADEQLEEFLAHARVDAETRIIESTRPFAETIVENSSDAALTFLGMRRPAADESDSAYGEYFHTLWESLSGLHFPVFVLANEEVEFNRIFT